MNQQAESGGFALDLHSSPDCTSDDLLTEFSGSDDTHTELTASIDDAATSINVVAASEQYTNQPHRERLTIGDLVIGDRYVIEREVAGGVEADAYVGRAAMDGRMVFIKHLRGFRTDRAAVEKKAMMRDRLLRIDHPNCLRLLDAEIAPDRVVEVYEFAAGQPLSTVITQLGGKPDRDFVTELVRQIAAGVSHLHGLGLAHRDLKPDNIIVRDEYPLTLKIGDYGTMTAVDEGGKTTFAGTRRYAPPESLRRSLLRDNDIMASDWWSVGRIVQEVVDGEHAYDRIAKRFPKLVDNADVQPIFDAILSEQERDVYGVRAGMVEWSVPEWQPLLRGLLTSKRQFRWSHQEVSEWLAGGTPSDAYDAAVDIEPFVFKGRRYDRASAARVLAQEENWDEAVRQVVEQDGIVRYVKRELQNKRVETRLAAIYEYYDELLKEGEDIADDLCTALALKLIASDSMPLTIRGRVLSKELVQAYAAEGKRVMVWALLSDRFRERIAAFDEDLARTLKDMQSEMLAVRDIVKSWNANEETQYKWDRMIYYRYAAPEELRRIVDAARAEFHSTSIKTLHAAFVNPACSERELAALAWILRSPQNWSFVTKIEMERREAAAVASRAAALSSAYGWAVTRKYHALNGALFYPWWVFAIAGVLTGGMFALYTAVALALLSIALRKTLGKFLADQSGGATFRGRNAPSAFDTQIADALGKNVALNVIEREFEECNDRLRAYAAKGLSMSPLSKGSPKFGNLVVLAMLVCVVAPIPLTMVINALMALVLHR